MEELKTILILLNDLWRFIKDYQGIPLTDEVCEKLREKQEALVEKYKVSENLGRLAGDFTVAVLNYLTREDKRRRSGKGCMNS